MRFSASGVAATLAFVAPAAAQGLSEGLGASIEGYSSFSIFRSILASDPGTFNTAVAKRSDDLTVFIPTDEAFKKYLDASGIQDVSAISAEDLQDFFAYHVADKSLKGSDFNAEGGLVVPTLLEDEKYNNRSAGAQIKALYGNDADGQVLFAKPTTETGGAKRFRRRSEAGSVTLRAGLGQDIEMTVLDGTWGNKSGNSFQAIDQVLQPPRECSTTIRSSKSQLSSLDAALNKTGLYPTLDTLKNVTCLGPTTEAFKKAGNPEIKLGKEDLTNALLAHTLKEVTYTTFLKDGQILETMGDGTVTVHIKGDDIYFNNAKIVNANVLTNNGLIHILDAVIGPEDDATKTGSSSTSTPTTVPTDMPLNAAGVLSTGYAGVVAVFAILAVM